MLSGKHSGTERMAEAIRVTIGRVNEGPYKDGEFTQTADRVQVLEDGTLVLERDHRREARFTKGSWRLLEIEANVSSHEDRT